MQTEIVKIPSLPTEVKVEIENGVVLNSGNLKREIVKSALQEGVESFDTVDEDGNRIIAEHVNVVRIYRND